MATMKNLEKVNENLSVKAKRDYKLIHRAIHDKDQKAYASLMGHYRDSIYFMLLKMVRSKDDAEDLTLEAFGKAFKKLHQYTPDYAFSTWLFKIASNNCIDHLRKKRAHIVSIDKKYDDGEGNKTSFTLESDGLDPEETAIKSQRIKAMRDVVQKLKPRYRKLIELRYFEELSYEEIATQMDLPLGTVKAQLFRGRDFLFNIMKNTIDKY